MADAGRGYGRAGERDTGVSQVLQAFAAQGGQLFGARRWSENPLTLTHVRWVGPAGMVLDGVREPEDDDRTLPEERDVWVQLALHFPSAHPSPAGPNAPWLPLEVDRTQAGEWAQALHQALRARLFGSQSGGSRQGQSYPQGQSSRYPAAAGSSPWRVPGSAPSSPPPSPPAGWPSEQRISGTPAQTVSDAFGARATAPVNSVPLRQSPPGGQAQGPWHSAQADLPEIVLLPSVEIDLPPLMPGGGPAGRREFARDTALAFARALRTLPQVGEMRGWLRGERLVLAARYVAGGGTRAATYGEMEAATQQVAETLARHTLPYAWLGFAEPGEWSQGAVLPE
jgi:hypothetical protein